MMTTDTTKPRPNARSQSNNSGYRLRALPPLADLLSDQETASRFFSSKPYPLPKHLTLIKNPRAAEFPGRQVIFWNEKDAAILSGRDAQHDANKQVMAKKKHTQTGEEKISHIVNDPLDKKIDAAKAYLMVAREQSFRKLHEEHPEHGYWRFGFDTPDWWPQDMEREVTRPKKHTHQTRLCKLRASERTPIARRMAEITIDDLKNETEFEEASPRPKQDFLGPSDQPIRRGQYEDEPLGIACIRKQALKDFQRQLDLIDAGGPEPEF
ncbi:hypothetical protein MCOR27_005291 [Pyricularia oryzae]|uniref:Uncharacterized protein n=2 Tax=Pyricularia TaxID=48558 RepID=A0ABQ8NAS2_PYRGI|nr:hypothetical protein MCOR01_009575 [Pyricularia oryzae]KAI6294081.1 hypothetical protein MCOR33_008707 [Pyricularia grisea]KAH9437155.1 hypothetical protein MCOR02_000809 [Pyricularia oryzae]KAI6260513.1 hypothetical protein MCOR19_003198 [Pyricularia oryzae]KAI6279154.1 hypothetical protein MCOR27_005291 [Pyricularia oryzae]